MVEGLERELQVGQGHLLNHGQLLARQRVRCGGDVVIAAAKRSPPPIASTMRWCCHCSSQAETVDPPNGKEAGSSSEKGPVRQCSSASA